MPRYYHSVMFCQYHLVIYPSVIDTSAMAGDTKIVAARRRRLRQWLDDRFGGGVGAQKAMIEDAKRRGYDINQGMLSGLLDNKSFGEVAAQNLEPKAGMPPG